MEGSIVTRTSDVMKFGRKLAALDKKNRDHGVKSLSRWLSNRKRQLSEIDLLRVWKALYYCMWLSDKSLVQQDLAVQLSRLIHVFGSPESSLLFVKTFFLTINREWLLLDSLRLDKFYMFIRKMLEETFRFLAAHQWQPSIVEKFMLMLSESSLNASDDKGAIGVKYHMIDIYIPELSKVINDDLSQKDFNEPVLASSTFTILFSPFLNLLSHASDQLLIQKVKKYIFKVLCEQHKKIPLKEPSNEDNSKSVESRFPIDFEQFSTDLFELASSRKISEKNRNVLYSVREWFNKAQLPEKNREMRLKKRLKELGTSTDIESTSSSSSSSSNVTLNDPLSSEERSTSNQTLTKRSRSSNRRQLENFGLFIEEKNGHHRKRIAFEQPMNTRDIGEIQSMPPFSKEISTDSVENIITTTTTTTTTTTMKTDDSKGSNTVSKRHHKKKSLKQQQEKQQHR